MAKKKRQADHSMVGDSSDSNAENEAEATAWRANDCPHINKCILLSAVKKETKQTLPNTCLDCSNKSRNAANTPRDEGGENAEDDEESLFICLRCGQCRCKVHGEKHSINKQTDPHDISINYIKWVVWCFKCKKELPDNCTKTLLECVELLRKKSSRVTASADEQEPQSQPTDVPPEPTKTPAPSSDGLPRVRGLANLGNTCYFNSVLQCLAQTPFLLPILEETRDAPENFKLPGGEVQSGEEKITLEPLRGTIKELPTTSLTYSLITTLEELQSGSSDVFVPRVLRQKLQEKCPQFAGFAEHDSHELLRQLLETVRNEDIGRYKTAILNELHLVKKSDRDAITDQQRHVIKAYGRQADQILLRPSHVFRGELVSTLRRLKCEHTTEHIESFLDLSLPVLADKPVHPRRRANSETNDGISKYQLKKERKAATKKGAKRRLSKYITADPKPEEGDKSDKSNSYGEDQSDADNEEEVEPRPGHQTSDVIESGYSSEKPGNGDSGCGSPSGSQLEASSKICTSAESGRLDENSVLIRNTLDVTGGCVEPGSSEHVNKGPMVLQRPSEEREPLLHRRRSVNVNLSPLKPPPVIELPPPPFASPAREAACMRLEGLNTDMNKLEVGASGDSPPDSDLSAVGREFCDPADTPLDSEGHGECAGALVSPHDSGDAEGSAHMDAEEDVVEVQEDAERTLAPRVIGPTNQCTLITCLNSFTAVELLTNNNKVSCDTCTEKLNGKGGKTVYKDASKQLLILNPPAVLILHLKRFQVQRFSSRKNSETVSFDPVLDLAPYCSVKCKNSGLVRKDQNEIRYALYGVVQHSGSMHGGHYVAHVKVRKRLSRDDPRWAFLPPGPNETGEEGSDGPQGRLPSAPPPPPPGKWYHVSDSHATETKEPRVLSSEAYLLFYERIW